MEYLKSDLLLNHRLHLNLIIYFSHYLLQIQQFHQVLKGYCHCLFLQFYYLLLHIQYHYYLYLWIFHNIDYITLHYHLFLCRLNQKHIHLHFYFAQYHYNLHHQYKVFHLPIHQIQCVSNT